MSKRLARLRKEKNLTQKQVADFLSIPVSTYRDWEYGRDIQGEPYLKLSEVFDVSLPEILGLRPSISKKELLNSFQKLKRSIADIENAIRPFL